MNMETNQSSLPALILISKQPRIEIPEISSIHSDTFTIGRGFEAKLKILDKSISRKHCSLEKRSSSGWIITSHSRNATQINNEYISVDRGPSVIKCGDKITFANVCSFVFKCAPDQNRKCCCDRAKEHVIPLDSVSEESSRDGHASVISIGSSSGSVESNMTTAVTQQNVQSLSVASTSFTTVDDVSLTEPSPLLMLSDLQEQVQKYMSEMNQSDDSGEKSINILKENMNHLKQLTEFNQKFSGNATNTLKGASLPAVRKLLCYCKTHYQNVDSCNVSECSDTRLKNIFSKMNSLLTEQMRLFMYSVPDLLEHWFPSDASSSRSSGNKEAEEISDVVPRTDILENKSGDSDGQLKDELKNYKQNSEWQEARIQYLEMKLKERDKLEKELESAREELEGLETQLSETRLKLSKMEVVELELNVLKESTKYKEDDKRSKDELEKQIDTLKNSIRETKSEIEKMIMVKSVLENENVSLKQKCEDFEKKLNTKVGCSSNAATGEYCCDLFSSLKDNILESLEKEFTCCICNEMFVGATVTNCNHVFCAFCLKEWKKKKKQCPFCRANLTSEHRANVIDECITNVVKFISDKLYAERMQMIEDRKNTATPPPAKRARRGRGSGVVQHAQMPVPITMRNHVYAGPAQINPPYAHQNFVIDLINLG